MSERQELAMPGLLEEMKKKINRPDKEFKKDAIVRALSEHAIKFKIPISNTTWVSDKLLLVTVDTYPLPSQEEVLLKNFGSEHGIEIDTVPF